MARFRLHILNQSHGDGLILEATDEGRSFFAVVDCHLWQPMSRYLEALSVNRLEAVVATHAHADHVLGLSKLLRSSIATRNLVVTHTEHPSNAWYQVLSAARERDVSLLVASQGGELALGPARIRVLGPSIALMESGNDLDENDRSLVLRVTLGESRAVLGGDALEACWSSVEHAPIGANPQKAQVLKVSHHGSINGGARSVLSVGPKVAVISAAGPGRGGHFPGEAALAILRTRLRDGGRLLSTAETVGGEAVESICLTTTGDRRWSVERHRRGSFPARL